MLQWRRKWSLKLRDRINRTLSLRKSLPLSETSDTKRIGAHQHQDGDDWVHTTLASTVAADSHDLHCEAENVFLEPAASTGSYYTVASTASLQSAQSNYRLDEPVEQLDDTAPDWASHSNELLSSPNSRTQIQRISFPAVPDSDPPPSPGLKSEYDAVPQDEALWESFRELHQESRWLAAGEKLRQCKSMHSAPQQAVHEVAKMVHSLDHFRESMRETSRYQQSSKQPLQVQHQSTCFAGCTCPRSALAFNQPLWRGTSMSNVLTLENCACHGNVWVRNVPKCTSTCEYTADGAACVLKQTPMQMFYRPPEQGQMHNIRAVADFCVKSVEILALAREFDLVKTWNWTVSESAILENRSEFDVDALAVLKMPWPYKPRFAAFSCKGGDLLDERSSLAVLFQSCCQVCLDHTHLLQH